MKLNRVFWFLMAGLITFQISGRAEFFFAEVKGIFNRTNGLALERLDPAEGTLEEFKIVVSPMTRLEGIHSVSELQAGDIVTVEAEHNENAGQWDATSVDLVREIHGKT